ncbi:MAG TPA: outer membrane protein transport protein [Vicinamibacterales bacterium]|jgi:long-chain fatty acid transport protein
MYRVSAIVALGILLGALVGGGTAYAQGYGVYEQGACMMGRSGAGVADPCADGSGAFFNPAALSMQATQITLGGVLIGPRGTFTDSSGGSLNGTVSTLNNHWYPVPNIYFSKPFAKKFAVGLGVFAPYGLTTDWPESSQGRFLGYKSVVQGVYLQPTISVKLSENVSVGGGIDLSYLNVELRQRLDLSTQAFGAGTFAALGVRAGTDFADVQLKGNAWHAGYHLGLLMKASEKVSIGMRFLAPQKVDVTNGTITTTQISAVKPDGTQYKLPVSIPGVAPAGTPLDALVKGQFAAGGKLSNQNATTTLPLPAQFVAGVAFKVTPTAKLFLDYQFTRWRAFDTLPVNGDYLKSGVLESYEDTHGVRIGTEILVGKKNVLRAGIDLHGGAAPDQTVTPNLPEGSRREFSVGFGSQISKRARFDVGYLYLGQPDRAGRTTAGKGAVPTAADNNGTFSFKAHLLGVSLTVGF